MGLLRTALLGMTLPPHLIADLGVGRDWIPAGDQRVGETNETSLLLSITRGFINSVSCDLVEANVLLLPVRQGELKLLTTPASHG